MVWEPGVLHVAWMSGTSLLDASLAFPVRQDLKTLADEVRNSAKKEFLLLFLCLYKETSKQNYKQSVYLVDATRK